MSLSVAVEQYRLKYVFLAPNDYDVSYVDIVAPEGRLGHARRRGGHLRPRRSAAPASACPREARRRARRARTCSWRRSRSGIQVMGYGSYTSYQYPGRARPQVDRAARR